MSNNTLADALQAAANAVFEAATLMGEDDGEELAGQAAELERMGERYARATAPDAQMRAAAQSTEGDMWLVAAYDNDGNDLAEWEIEGPFTEALRHLNKTWARVPEATVCFIFDGHDDIDVGHVYHETRPATVWPLRKAPTTFTADEIKALRDIVAERTARAERQADWTLTLFDQDGDIVEWTLEGWTHSEVQAEARTKLMLPKYGHAVHAAIWLKGGEVAPTDIIYRKGEEPS